MPLALVVLQELAEPLHFLPRVQFDARIDAVQLELGRTLVAPRLSSLAFSKIQAVARVRHDPPLGEITHHALRHQDFDRLMSGFSKPYQLPENRFWKINRDSLRGHANP
ncbi:hypothetical protein H6F86_23590 [Phormidium sp. FACHB-592]|uniref:Uncharacterized protein n=1 Tax=Stenomitos frigidus AS-A4 TaxID=2933935 RepID=A0ABV0KTV3_9CYAN|nr:hypothetical protein [Phormidium sp. FACHB-592]MBD2076816.1 hypothetical protein [Phormidium sp. FACHB-592]